jgi:hypothetical protein
MNTDTEAVIATQLQSNPGALSLLQESLAWMAGQYDENAQLLASPHYNDERHLVRESIWYALGLIVASRCLPDLVAQDMLRVPLMVRRVLQAQWHAPGAAWHGTFRRAPQEGDPPQDARVWRDYDPNWRQFIGTVLVLLLRLEGNALLADDADDIRRALKECVRGEPVDRVPPSYTNIALMRAWLETETVELVGEEYRARGLAYAGKIVAQFNENGTFQEYNSPTYYGINMFALGLWQHYSTEPVLRQAGTDINAALWRDMARFYHAGMKNLCGPWSRAYGMDMQRYVAAVGLWIWSAVGERDAPFPMDALHNDGMKHAHDFGLGPLAAITATPPPADAAGSFGTSSGESFIEDRLFSQIITRHPDRQAYAWLTPSLMVGLETADISFRGNDQYHPFTVHWLQAGRVHWLRLRFKGRLQGEIRDGAIHLTLIPDDGTEHCLLQSSDAFTIDGERWQGAGLGLHAETTLHASAAEDGIVLDGIHGPATITMTPIRPEEIS